MALRAYFQKEIEKQKKRETKAAPVIIDDDDEDDFTTSKTRGQKRTTRASGKRKRARIQDDSESEEEVSSSKKQKLPAKKPTPKKTNVGGTKKTAATPTKVVPKKKEVTSLTDFFGIGPIKRTTRSSGRKEDGDKRAKVEKQQATDAEVKTVPESPTEAAIMEFSDEAVALALQEDIEEMSKEKERLAHEDAEFEKTLTALDGDVAAKPVAKASQPSPSKPPSKKLKLMMDRIPVSRSRSGTPQGTPTKEKTKGTPTKEMAKGTPTKVMRKSTPTKEIQKSTPTREKRKSTPTKEIPRPSPKVKSNGKATSASRSLTSLGSKGRAMTSLGTKGGVRYFDDDDEEEREFKGERRLPKASSRVSTSPVKRVSSSRSPVTPITTPPPERRQTTPTRGKASPKKSTPQPAPSSSGGSSTTPAMNRAQSFLRYKNRAGPRAPGSKEIPQGAENCLEGLTFVITGVLESLERDDAADIIKKYGGKVTTSISGRTSYIVVGEEAGESKLAKAQHHGTKQIDEDGLLNLIRTLPSPSKKAGKKPIVTAAAASKSKTKAKSKSKSPSPAKPTVVKSRDPLPVRPSSHKMSSASSFYSSSSSSTAMTATATPPSAENLLWVDKYRPRSTKQIIGQQGDRSNAKKLANWLQNWERNHGGGAKGGVKKPPWGGGGARDDGSSYKAALLSGPPGIGKTTTATLVCEENGYSYVEMNASSTRSKKTLHNEVASQLSCLSLESLVKGGVASGRRHVLIMDEVDGMAGNEDRGGMQELIQMIKTTKIPIICICNDRQSLKIRSLSYHCFDLRFQRPKVDQIKGAMMSLCFKEGLTIEPQALREVIMASGQDVRQVVHNLSLWSASSKKMDSTVVHQAAMNAKKNSKMGPFDVVRTVFSPFDGERELSLNEKSDLFFHDYSMASLFVQENYVNAKPSATRGNVAATLKCIAMTADSLCDSDLVEKKIRSSSNWGLLPLQAFFSSVIPGERMKGFLGRPEFPQWLGQNSKRQKFDRILQELQRHTRLSTSCSKLEFGMDYLHHFRSALTAPLLSRGVEGVPDVVSSMEYYDLLRSDWDLVCEIAQFSKRPDYAAQIPAKVKTAFTKAYNKEGHLSHYSVASAAKKSTKRSTLNSQSEYGDLDEEGGLEVEQDSDSDGDVSSNPAIKVRKGSQSSSSQSSGKGKKKNGSQGNGTRKKRTKS